VGPELIKRRLANLGLLAGTIVICLFFLELAFRAAAGVPVFAIADWRAARVIESDETDLAEYNELVGWDVKSGIRSGGFNTTDLGIRKNSADASDGIRQNGILVIGDSFVAGSQVADSEAWPAQLEDIIHQSVLNAAVGGWGIDQMELRVRQLFEASKPKVVILGGENEAILRIGYSSYGRPKPYYTLEDSNLVLHNVPVPRVAADPRHRFASKLKVAMSYSYVIDQVAARTAPGWWYSDERSRYYQTRISVDAVACALAKDIKKQSETMGYRVLYVMQYDGARIEVGTPLEYVEKFEACARAAGLQVVDDFDVLHAIAAAKGIKALKREYNMEPTGEYGHMSVSGNRLVAELVAQALQQNTQAATSR
jgi:hypothetical protein